MNTAIKVLRKISDLRETVAQWRRDGQRIALVPTMGALHDGHLSLVKLAQQHAGKVVVSIFVNPTQFGPNEDLARYPRDEAGDLAKLKGVAADAVWAPTVEEMYPPGASTRILPGSAAADLEGAVRPHHFSGVATVCCKLFSQVAPDFAVFGEKDYQQLTVLRQMVRDLNLPLELIGAPTQREADGLAMSSRNRYLSERERKIAPALHRIISELAKDVGGGADIPSGTVNAVRRLKAAGFDSVDYVEVRDAMSLAALGERAEGRNVRILAAARLGKTRLIDNVAAPAPQAAR